MEIFWRTIAYYNSATWLLQIVIILIGIALTGLLIGRPRPWVKMAMKFYMIGLYTWISLVYYYIYCEERSYNGVMAMFWGRVFAKISNIENNFFVDKSRDRKSVV